jgi:acetylornithine deacetylase/succinyl-diaminopimelate desuccinylase-like protein
MDLECYHPRTVTIDATATRTYVQRVWDESIVPALTEYVRIPAKSPHFDAKWKEHGHIDRAVALLEDWSVKRAIEGLRLDVVRLPGRTPGILIDVPGASDEIVLLYGHCDKQPEMVGWAEGLGPWIPARKGDRLFGRGVGDDGYATFSALTAIEALQAARVPHARCIVLIEACEESGSYDLPAYMDALASRIGTPSLVVCLDSGCGNYEQLWVTTALRGIVNGELTVQVLEEGVHSGAASGIVPSSFRIMRQLLSRLEDEVTGEIRPRDFHVDIPRERVEQARAVAQVLGKDVIAKYPFVPGMRPVADDAVELLLNNTWRPALAITGAAGLPLPADGGNVLRPETTVKLSLRVPPTCDAERAARALKELLEEDPPYGAKVTYKGDGSNGWDAPPTQPWLLESAARASKAYFGKGAMYLGIGGSIPFMSMLGERFPKAQFLITGVMGPGSNAHGPNEFLDLPTGAKVTACVAQVLADHYRAAKA